MGKNKNGTARRKLSKLFKQQDGKCFYCGADCLLPESGKTGQNESNLATVEHLVSRLDIRRLLLGNIKSIGMSCHNCNCISNEKEKSNMQSAFDKIPKHPLELNPTSKPIAVLLNY